MPISKSNPRKTVYGGKSKTHKSAKAAKAYSKRMKKRRYK